jgi:aarF domain-containing kinase
MKEELADECNYAREAACMRSFGSAERLGGDERFKVPWVWEGSTDRVLVMELVDGTSVGGDAVHRLPQADRDEVRLPRPPPPSTLANAMTTRR